MSPAVLSELHQQLSKMRDCKGEHCTHYHGKKYPATSPTLPTHAREPVNKTKESIAVIRSPTLPSHVKTSLTSERPYRSEVVVNTSNAANHTSVMTESFEGLSFTTSVPTKANVKTLEQSRIQSTVSSKRRKVQTSVENRVREEVEKFVGKKTQTFSAEESSPMSTQNTNRAIVTLNRMSQSQKNVSSHSGDSKKSNREQINVEKPLQHTVAAGASSSNVPTTVISKSLEPDTSFLEANVSSILPTLASTSRASKKYTSRMHSTVKPTREKSPKRRKNGERVDRKREKETHVGKQKQKNLKRSWKSKKKSAKENSRLPKENVKKFEVSKNPDRTSESRKNISHHFSENFKNERSGKEQMTVEKPSQVVTGSQDLLTTALVKPSESSETTDSSALSPSPSKTLTHAMHTSEINVKEMSTLKPTGKKSAKRRKHGEREHDSSEMETPKTSKKLRKAKKMTLEKQSPPLNNGSLDKQVIKTAENQTQVQSKGERLELESNGNKKQNELLPGSSRKRSKKPSSKRSANRNSKKRSKQRPSKRQRPSQISEGDLAKSEPPAENGGGVQEEPSPTEP